MRQYIVIIPLLILGLLNVFIGCERDIKGPIPENNKPIVNFVNIPVKDALFSSDTTIYWYGSDVDGFIDSFYYIVIRQSDVGEDVDAYISAGGLPLIDSNNYWTPIKVKLDNTGTSARVQMSADISDPVRQYVTSYVFLIAVDNEGERSDVVYRSFAKNNHFPSTALSVRGYRDPYINAINDRGILEGVTIEFSAHDRIDYPRNPPPFEYRWKVFGPFNDSMKAILDSAYTTDAFVDLYGDFYQHGDTLSYFRKMDTIYTIDTIDENTFDTVKIEIDSAYNEFDVDLLLGGNAWGIWTDALLGVDPIMDSMVLDSNDYDILADKTLLNEYLVDSSLNWTFNTYVPVYDVFRNQSISPDADTTRLMSFLVWCQARDDAQVPDPVPDFRFITVIEPKFERDVIIVDATSYTRSNSHNWPVFPRSPWDIADPDYSFPDTSGPAVRDVFAGFINSWKPGSFDADTLIPDEIYCQDEYPDCKTNPDHADRHYFIKASWRFGTTQDYYAIREVGANADSGWGSISLCDVLKHKIAIVVKDNTTGTIGFDDTIEGLAVVDGLNSGMNAWVMARAAEGVPEIDRQALSVDSVVTDIDDVLREYFGVWRLHPTGWQDINSQKKIRIEDFIGANTLNAELPHLLIDTTRLESLYLWDSTNCSNPELPCYPFRDLDNNEILYGAMPEVGYVVRGLGSEPLYVYKSKYGRTPPDNFKLREGTVVAIRQQNEFNRTAFFCFNIIAMDEVSGREVFEKMMDWLSVLPYINAGKVNPNYFGSNVNKYRNISRRMHDLKRQGLLRSISEQ